MTFINTGTPTFQRMLHGQLWKGKDIYKYKPFFKNTDKCNITETMIKKSKRNKEYFIIGATMPFMDDEDQISAYAEYAGYSMLYKVPVKEIVISLPGYGDHLIKYFKKFGWYIKKILNNININNINNTECED